MVSARSASSTSNAKPDAVRIARLAERQRGLSGGHAAPGDVDLLGGDAEILRGRG